MFFFEIHFVFSNSCVRKKLKQVRSEIKEEFFLSSEKKTKLPRRVQSPVCPPNNMVEFMPVGVLTLLFPMHPFLYLLKTSENLTIF